MLSNLARQVSQRRLISAVVVVFYVFTVEESTRYYLEREGVRVGVKRPHAVGFDQQTRHPATGHPRVRVLGKLYRIEEAALISHARNTPVRSSGQTRPSFGLCVYPDFFAGTMCNALWKIERL